jgi:hypothetical protein
MIAAVLCRCWLCLPIICCHHRLRQLIEALPTVNSKQTTPCIYAYMTRNPSYVHKKRSLLPIQLQR